MKIKHTESSLGHLASRRYLRAIADVVRRERHAKRRSRLVFATIAGLLSAIVIALHLLHRSFAP